MESPKRPEESDHQSLEERRTLQILYYFGVVSVITLFSMSFLNWLEREFVFVSLTFVFGVLISLSMVHLYYRKNKAFSVRVYTLVILMLTVNLAATGGVDGHGLLWVMLFPPLVYFLQGIARGTFTIGVIFIIILGYFYVPNLPLQQHEFAAKFKLRFLVALTAGSLISFFAEYSRHSLTRKLVELSKTLKDLSRTDELTKIMNRRGGLEALEHTMHISMRSGLPFSVLLFDIDRFKEVNDQFGHQAGDQVICTVVERVRQEIRQQDVFCRWGGEEFFLVLPNTEYRGLATLAEKLRLTISQQPYQVNNHAIGLSCSFGGAQFSRKET